MSRNGTYDVAQVCLNGHIVNSSTQRESIHNKKYCPRCGSQTITNCLNCMEYIDGDYYKIILNYATRQPSSKKTRHFILPLFCTNCGLPFPWTETKIAISRELISEESNLSQEEKELFSKSVDDIIRDTPNTVKSARKIRQLLPKLGKEILKDIRKIFVDIASETAKRIIFPE
jgi:hypothetical protein